MAILRIQLLGGFRLTHTDAPLQSDASPALQSLLAYLLLQRGAPQTRAQISFALYPDSSDAQAQSNLRTLLVRLRRALPNSELYLRADAHGLEWRLDAPCAFDVAEFESAAAQANRDDLDRAANLYRGDLLPDCYDEWIQPPRERLRQLYLSVIERLSDALERDGDFLPAILRAQQLLQFDPLQETFYQRLMRLYAARGDYAGVARAYQACLAVLQQELGVEPGPETRALYERLQSTAASVSPPRPPSGTEANRHLPLALTAFIGREPELAEIERLLSPSASGEERLLTLTGPGGVGKSSLAVQAGRELADNYPDGVWFVDLSAVADPAFIPNAIAALLDVRDTPKVPLLDALSNYMSGKRLLLLLDNCEHLLAGCAPVVETLLSAASRLQILATSRKPLGIQAERAWRVPPLATPAGRDYRDMASNEAVRLFAERAALALPTFALTPRNAPVVTDICRQLDGLPLAIELAAARVRLLSVEQIAARLDDRFNLLTAGDPKARPRHHTLRALFDWSYELLSADERALLRWLAVFTSGFTLEAAEFLAAGASAEFTVSEAELLSAGVPLTVIDLLARLADHSLIVVDAEHAHGSARYRMLDTIRRYALEKLEASGETRTLLARRLDWCVSFAEQAAPQLVGAEQADWLARLEAEQDNFRVALQRALDTACWEPGLRLAGALWRFWNMRGYFSEGCAWLEGFIARAPASPSPARALALHGASGLRFRQGQYERAVQHSETSLAIQRALANPQGTADSLNLLGVISVEQGDYERAEKLYTESLELRRALQDPWGISTALINLGLVARNRGDFAAATVFFEQALELKRQMGDKYGIGLLLNNIGDIAIYQGDYARAALRVEESIAIRRELGDQFGLGQSLNNLAVIACYEGDEARAEALLEESLALHQAISDQQGIAIVFINRGMLARLRGDLPRAAEWQEEALALFNKIEHPWGIALASNELGVVTAERGDTPGAAQLHSRALRISQEANNQLGIAQALEGLANAASLNREAGRAAQLLGRATALREKINAPPVPPDHIVLERIAERASSVLGAEAYGQAQAKGRALPLDQAIELALRQAQDKYLGP